MANNAIRANNSRLQVEVSAPQLAQIQALMSVCEFRTQKELINNALTLFEWAVEEVQRGNEVASFNKPANSYEVLRMPALKTAARHGQVRPVAAPSGIVEERPTIAPNHPSRKLAHVAES